MSSRLLVPMTKAVGMGPLPRMLEERVGWRAVEIAFAAGEVPLDIIRQQETRMPVASMMALFESAGRAAGDRTFGFAIGAKMSPESYGLWMDYSISANTLGEALRRTVLTARFHQTGGHLALETKGGFAIWR